MWDTVVIGSGIGGLTASAALSSGGERATIEPLDRTRCIELSALPTRSDVRALRLVKLAHTAAWAVLAGCVVAVPVMVGAGYFRSALACAAIVAVEVLVLAANAWRCPLTSIAERYTTDRRDNFDIYLPAWLARYNKLIFGTLYVVGLLFLLWSAVV